MKQTGTPLIERPLDGIVVLDLSRMLPGAVLARQLLDLGARVVKVEEPAAGDPMRLVPPVVGGVGTGFAVFFRGAESVCLDLRREEDQARVARLAGRVDVVVESFRPGTLERWGLAPAKLIGANPRLVVCSLPAFPSAGVAADRVGHDLNFVASCGLLSLLPGHGVARIQIADFTAGLLAVSSIVAALLTRASTGRGGWIEQPLATAPLAWLGWPWADAAAGGLSGMQLLLGGRLPCYRLYRCGEDGEIAVGALEPKFWTGFVGMLGLDGLARHGMDPGEDGRRAAAEIERVLATQPRAYWLERARELGLPVSAVHTLEEAREDPFYSEPGILETIRTPGGETVEAPGPALASGVTPDRPAPALGEHTRAILREFDA
ncbi:MAG: CoA transferase [Acidobacteria bacterium]|nr:CoA transferase [Acidobacteriota bacterium]